MHLHAFPHPHVNLTLVGMAAGVAIIPPLVLAFLFYIARWL
jgi:hypothetical protein